jgi:N-acetylneuraminic acid mutarotase
VADKVLFAGGDGGFTGPGRERRVDIYNLTTNSWSTAQLSEPKQGPTAVTANGKIFFAGGHTHNNATYFVSDKIDIYDNATNTWSVAALNERRVGHGGIAVADKIYWAGGSTTGTSTSLLCSVEIRGVNMGNTVIQSLSEPSGGPALLKNNKILFFTINGINDNAIDIYDVSSASWSIGVLPQSIYGSSVFSVNNIIYVTGGRENGVLSNQVWKLEF